MAERHEYGNKKLILRNVKLVDRRGRGDEADGGRLGDCSELCRAPRHTDSGVQLADSPIATLGSVGSTPANFPQGHTHTNVFLKLSATNVLLCLTCSSVNQ